MRKVCRSLASRNDDGGRLSTMRVTSTSSSQYPAVYFGRGIYQLIHWCNNCPSVCHTKSRNTSIPALLSNNADHKPPETQSSPIIHTISKTHATRTPPQSYPNGKIKKIMRAIQLLRRPLHTSPLPATVSTQSASCFSSSSGRPATDNPNVDPVSNVSREEHKTGDDHPARQPDPQAQPTRSTGVGGQAEVKGGKEGLGERSDRTSGGGTSGRGKGKSGGDDGTG